MLPIDPSPAGARNDRTACPAPCVANDPACAQYQVAPPCRTTCGDVSELFVEIAERHVPPPVVADEKADEASRKLRRGSRWRSYDHAFDTDSRTASRPSESVASADRAELQRLETFGRDLEISPGASTALRQGIAHSRPDQALGFEPIERGEERAA